MDLEWLWGRAGQAGDDTWLGILGCIWRLFIGRAAASCRGPKIGTEHATQSWPPSVCPAAVTRRCTVVATLRVNVGIPQHVARFVLVFQLRVFFLLSFFVFFLLGFRNFHAFQLAARECENTNICLSVLLPFIII